MKKRTAFIGAILSLIPLGQPLLIKTGLVLSTAGLIISVPEKVNAESADFYFDRALEKSKKGDYYGAISDFSKAIEINPYDDYAFYNRGWNKAKLKDHYGAISDYTKAIEINPHESAYYNRGISKRTLKDYYGAISDYKKSIEINPQKLDAYNNISYIKRNKEINDNYGAIFYATKAIEIDPNYSSAYLNRGVAKENLGDMNGACDDWRKASSLGNESTAEWVRNQC